VYTPHKRRGPISAEFTSPGPAAISLPGYIGRNDANAITMGSKLKDLKKPNVPAPNAYNSERSEEYLEGGIQHSFGVKPDLINKFKTPAPNAYDSEKGEEYLEGGIKHSFGVKPDPINKFKTPAPNAYNSEKGEDYLEGGIKHSFGIKPEPLNKFKTPGPNTYNSERGDEYLEGVKAITIGARLKEAKKFLTPSPNKYEVAVPDENPSFAFGIKHSPYMYNGRELGREKLVSSKADMDTNGGEFRQRSGTFTRNKPVVATS